MMRSTVVRKIVFHLLSVAILGSMSAASVGATLQSRSDAPTEESDGQLNGYFTYKPWQGGTHGDALAQTLTGATIPMAGYSIASTKDGSSRTGTIVGTSPFDLPLTGSTIPMVVVPVKITIGSSVFDPTAANSCDGGVSTVDRFMNSPLVTPVPNLTFNGVNVGTAQFADGFRRAEFWNQTGGSAAYQNTLAPVTLAPVQSLSAGTNGTTYQSGCSMLGVVYVSWLDSQLTGGLLPQLTSAGLVGPDSFVAFLLDNVVESSSSPPNARNCCFLGYHSAIGNPVQTYGVMDWETTGLFGNGVADASVASHEIAEWLDDPLATNPTPPWGHIGQVGACQTNLEVGDPLSGTLMPTVTLGGKAYHLQELAFFDWFFDARGVGPLGAGNTFSSKGSFAGPSEACPPGGTFPNNGPTSTATVTPTDTVPVATATATNTAIVATPTPTNTVAPATATATDTAVTIATPTATPTNTIAIATATGTNTPTRTSTAVAPTVTPTRTPVSGTALPTATPCGGRGGCTVPTAAATSTSAIATPTSAVATATSALLTATPTKTLAGATATSTRTPTSTAILASPTSTPTATLIGGGATPTPPCLGRGCVALSAQPSGGEPSVGDVLAQAVSALLSLFSFIGNTRA